MSDKPKLTPEQCADYLERIPYEYAPGDLVDAVTTHLRELNDKRDELRAEIERLTASEREARSLIEGLLNDGCAFDPGSAIHAWEGQANRWLKRRD